MPRSSTSAPRRQVNHALLSRIVVCSFLVVLAVKPFQDMVAFGLVAHAAPVRATTGSKQSSYLYIRGTYVRYQIPEGLTCVTVPQRVLEHPGLSGSTLVASLGMIGLKFAETRPDRSIVYKSHLGQTVIARNGSSVVIVDGRQVQLEDELQSPFGPGLVGPLNTLAPLVGYDLKFGRLPSRPGERDLWFLSIPKGQRMPEPIDVARRVLTDRRSWLLLLDSPGGEPYGGCGRMARVSGLLEEYAEGRVDQPRDAPWGKLRDLARELRWQVSWDPGRGAGVVRSKGRTVQLRYQAEKLALNGIEYRVPPSLARGEPVIPIGPVARALGLSYWECYCRTSGIGTR